MNLKELDSFKISDAIGFHDELNPELWQDDHLISEVKEQLELIAQDFLDELGVSDLDVKDITVSGSNAAYSYTPHSDIDLHILVDMSSFPDSDIYFELFNAKKNLYNDSHEITVHGVPVELYVQDANEPVVSLGEYSIMNDKWIRTPTKRRANFDQNATRAKYEKLRDLIVQGLKSHDVDKIDELIKKVKQYRQAGLDHGGEFSPENLAYKALRSEGLVDKMYNLRDKLHSRSLSIEEDNKPLDEVLNTKPGKKNSAYWKHEGEEGSTLHFDASNGLKYRLDIMPLWLGADEAHPWGFADTSDEQDDNGRYVEFSQVGSDWIKNITGTGSAAEIFGIVSNGILQYVKKFKPPFLMMQAAEMNRRRLYSAMLTRLLPMMPGYKSMGPKADGMYFIYDSRVIKPKTNKLMKTSEISLAESTLSLTKPPIAKLDKILVKLCKMIIKGQHSNNNYGMVAACVIDPDNNMVARISSQNENGKWSHAERNAIEAYENKYGAVPPDSIVVTTLSPCNERHDKTAKERSGTSCTDYINSKGIKNVYCGYMDPTQDNDTRNFNVLETSDKDIRKECKKIADTFLQEDETLQYASEKTPAINPYGGLEDNQFRSGISEAQQYKEIEFVCANPQFPDATDPALQKKMYVLLKTIPGVIPLYQDQSDYSEGQMSLTAIFKSPESRQKILKLAKHLGVQIDLIQPVSDDYVDRAIRGEHEGQINEASGYIPSEKEKNDPRFKTALTVDVKPNSIKKNAKAFGFKTSRAGIPPTLRP